MGTVLAGDSLVPTEYKAVAQYSGNQCVTYVTGYTTTVNYNGIVTKKTVDSVMYTITYTGKLIPPPPTEPPATTEPPAATEPETTTELPVTAEAVTTAEPETEPESENEPAMTSGFGAHLPYILIITALLAAAGGGFAFMYFKYIAKTKKKTEASVYNLIDGEYILLGTVPLDPQNPAADLNQFGDTIKSDDFGFALDAYSAETLDGKNINITYKERTLSHTVQKKGKSGEYTFQLGFGG